MSGPRALSWCDKQGYIHPVMEDAVPSTKKSLLPRRVATVGLLASVVVVISGGIWMWQQGRAKATTTIPDPMAAELARAAERADVCMASNAAGVGLRGEYFAASGLKGDPVMVRVDDVVDFDDSIRAENSSAGAGIGSVRWTGWVKAPISGRYRFHADAPGVRITVARTVVAGVGASGQVEMDLAAGRFYPIEVVLLEVSPSEKRIRLEWTAPHGARYVVPKSLLHLPTDTVGTTR